MGRPSINHLGTIIGHHQFCQLKQAVVGLGVDFLFCLFFGVALSFFFFVEDTLSAFALFCFVVAVRLPFVFLERPFSPVDERHDDNDVRSALSPVPVRGVGVFVVVIVVVDAGPGV